MMMKHLYGMCHLVGVLLLSACGGGDPDAAPNSTNTGAAQHIASAAPSSLSLAQMPRAPTALGVQPAGSVGATLPLWSDQVTKIYEDRYAVPFGVVLEKQFEISESGEAFMGWYRTHKTADGTMDGTAVLVTRYDAATQSWIADQVALVPFPSAGGGYIYNLQMMALPQGDMLMLWDVVNADGYYAFTPPQVYFSRYSAQQKHWSEPQRLGMSYGPTPGQWGLYRAGSGWKAYPAGRGRLLLLWERMGQLYGNFYVAAEARWLEPENVGAGIGFQSSGAGWSAADSRVAFNQSGTGVVRIDGYKALYFDAVSQQWRVSNIIPTDWYRPELLVGEEGDVFMARLRYSSDAPRSLIDLHKWSSKTFQIQRLVELETGMSFNLNLYRRPGGVVLVWDSVLPAELGVASVSNDGVLVERAHISPDDEASTSSSLMASWDADDQGRVTFVLRSCQMALAVCGNTLSRTYTPGQGLSSAVQLQLPPDPYHYSPFITGYSFFKKNAQGGALFVRQFDDELKLPPGDHSVVQVYAKVLR